MKKTVMSFMVVAMSLMASLLFIPGAAMAQSGGQLGAWTLDMPYMPNFNDLGPIETFNGKVVKVEKMTGAKDGVQLRFVTDENAKFIVLLGPAWFVSHQKIKFMAGDMVEVRGMKVGGKIIATEASKGDWTMKLRNEEDGMPAWQCCFPRSK